MKNVMKWTAILAVVAMLGIPAGAFAQTTSVNPVGANTVGQNTGTFTSTVGAITNSQTIGAQTINGGVGSVSATGGSVGPTTNNNDSSAVSVQGQKQKQGQSQGQGQGQSTDVTIGGDFVAPSLIQLPGLMGAYQQFTQPYKPEVFINGAGAIRPKTMTYDQADRCASGLGFWGSSVDYAGGSNDSTKEIALYYPAWDKVVPTGDLSGYVGTTSVSAKDKPWLTTLCAAAKKAMDKGASVGVVEFVIRPVNKSAGVMIGASFGGSGIAGAATNPYALAGTLGGGLGWSNAYVQGELLMQVTGMTTTTPGTGARSEGPAVSPVSMTDVQSNPIPSRQ
jgi:hypothetical protein